MYYKNNQVSQLAPDNPSSSSSKYEACMNMTLTAIPGLLALIPIIVIPIVTQPNLSPSDDILIILFSLFALAVTVFAFETSTIPSVASSEQKSSQASRYFEPVKSTNHSRMQDVVAFLTWSLFRVIVSIDSLEDYRPKLDVHLMILFHVGAFFSLLITITLYQQIIKHIQDRYKNDADNTKANIWWSITIQLIGFMMYFMAMLLQLLIQPPISSMIYVLNFILLVYTVYAIISISVQFGAVSEVGLSMFFATLVIVVSFVNQLTFLNMPMHIFILYSAVNLFAVVGAWVIGYMAFSVLFNKIDNTLGFYHDQETKEVIVLAVLGAQALLIVIGCISIFSPPISMFDFAMEMFISIGASFLTKYYAYREWKSYIVLPLLIWVVALNLIGALASNDLPHPKETAVWMTIEMTQSLIVSVIVALVQFNMSVLKDHVQLKRWMTLFALILGVLVSIVCIAFLPRTVYDTFSFSFTATSIFVMLIVLMLVRRFSPKQNNNKSMILPTTTFNETGVGLGELSSQEISRMMMQQLTTS
jgi:hypothetical protein